MVSMPWSSQNQVRQVAELKDDRIRAVSLHSQTPRDETTRIYADMLSTPGGMNFSFLSMRHSQSNLTLPRSIEQFEVDLCHAGENGQIQVSLAATKCP